MSDESEPEFVGGEALLFALRRESAAFTRKLIPYWSRRGTPYSTRLFKTQREPIAVLETGVGADRATAAARWLLGTHRPRLVVACGFAGALSPSLKLGDVLIASEVVEPGD